MPQRVKMTNSKEIVMWNVRILLRGSAKAAGAVAAALALIIALVPSCSANDIIDDWATVKPPPVPELKPVTLDGATTALLVMDIVKTSCTSPRCMATLPNVKRLHDAAQAAGAMLWVALGNDSESQPADVPGFVPGEGEWERSPGPDKFFDSDLDQRLKGRHIKTVVLCGVSFQGDGLSTATGAAERGYNVVVPVDCFSSKSTYQEQYAAWHLFKGGPGKIVRQITLTRSTMVKF
jgi:nicotinamidase-related amidase